MAAPGVTAGAVLALALVAQVSLGPRLAATGATPDLLLLAVAAVAATRGRETGAAFGFVAGLAADAFLATPAGLSALAFTLVGHVVGGGAPSGRRRPGVFALLAGAACLAGGALVTAAAVLLGEAPPPPPPVLLRLLTSAGAAALLAPAVLAGVARLAPPPGVARPSAESKPGRR